MFVGIWIGAGVAPALGAPDEWDDPPAGSRYIEDPSEFADRISGYWVGDWGDIIFRVDPDGFVTAAYTHDSGVIVGWMEGATIQGWWCEVPSRNPPSDAGSVQFRLVDTNGAASLDGRWTYGHHEAVARWSDNWDVTERTETTAPDALLQRLEEANDLCAHPDVRPRPWTTLGVRFEAATPSVISSLPRMQELDITPARVAAAGVASMVLVALVMLPQTLLDATVSANADRWSGFMSRLRRRRSAVGISGRALVVAGLVLTAVISGFVDPKFGLNPGSLRLGLSLTVAIFIESVLGLWLVGRLVRDQEEESQPQVTFKMSSLVIVVASVVLSRLVGFEPGIVFGFVFGLVFAREMSRGREARIGLLGCTYGLVVGLGAWVVYSVLGGATPAEGGFLTLFVVETFGGLAVATLAALPIALFPMAVTDGGVIFRWSKKIWILAYVVALTVFMLIVIPLPASWSEISGSFTAWVGIFVAYCVVAVVVWYFFGRSRPEDEVVAPDLITP